MKFAYGSESRSGEGRVWAFARLLAAFPTHWRVCIQKGMFLSLGWAVAGSTLTYSLDT